MPKINNFINHFWLDLDASSSMTPYKDTLIRVVDEMISNMAKKSTEMEQETRITINTFATRGNRQCLVWDKDVLRMPSIADLYSPYGWTAMVEAVCISVDEMGTIPTIHGDHSFVGYTLTDGDENDSPDKYALKPRAASMEDNWTLAALVPDESGRKRAALYGFPSDNIQIWDATSVRGVEEVIRKIDVSTSDFMTARTRGVRGTKSLFSLNTVSSQAIKKNLDPVSVYKYSLHYVPVNQRIDDFVASVKGSYVKGEAYYELTKTEEIQPQKKIAILHNNQLYSGISARNLLGLPDYTIKVGPDSHPGYRIFVQSTSVNRKLIAGTNVLILK